MISALEALERLRAGNRRFVSGARKHELLADRECRAELVAGQHPFAIILGCSDSRVIPEIVFDRGFGDLFVVRVAGNVAESSQVGSIEYAVEQFGTRLIVVLGHSRCGAVTAAIDEITEPGIRASGNQRVILDRVRSTVETLLAAESAADPDNLLRRAVRANIRASAGDLRRASELLGDRSQTGELLIVEAEYSLETGLVDFFDSTPEGVDR